MNVSAIIVTRGNVDLDPVVDSLPKDWEIIVWENGGFLVGRHGGSTGWWTEDAAPEPLPDLSVFGRYEAIKFASHDLIYVQDDDVIVSDPQAIMEAWHMAANRISDEEERIAHDHLVANMPQEFRHDGYTDSCLVGFGACFHRDLPQRAWDKFNAAKVRVDMTPADKPQDFFYRTCDVVFTTLTPRVLVDVPKTNREFAEDPDRMYRQPEHYGERVKMLELARKVRDAGV